MCVLLLTAPALSQAQAGAPTVTLNRVVASVDRAPLTERDVEQEYRLEAFLATGKVPADSPTSAEMTRARSRLIDQTLLEQASAEYSFDSGAVSREAAAVLAGLKKKFANAADFDAALRELGMTGEQLLAKLKEHAEILQLIDAQLRPSATVSAQDIRAYYEKTLVPGYAGKGSPPALKNVQGEIHEVLVQQKINQLLDQWLAELKKEHPVRILGESRGATDAKEAGSK